MCVVFRLVNCLDRHVEENEDKPAFIWEKDEPGTHEVVTYGSVHTVYTVYMHVHIFVLYMCTSTVYLLYGILGRSWGMVMYM